MADPVSPTDPIDDQDRRYRDLDHAVAVRYGAGRLVDALVLTEDVDLPAYRSDVAHTRACLLALLGRPEDALAALRQAYDDGGWWHPRILDGDDDLAAVRDVAGWADLVAASAARAEVAHASEPEPARVLTEPAGPAGGLLLVLHGAGDGLSETVEWWSPAVDLGWATLAVESTQRNTPAYRSWPDPDAGRRDVTAALDAMPSDLRDVPLVLGGFSAGARQALLLALDGTPGRPRAFVLVAPAVTPDDVIPDRLPAAAGTARGLSGTILLGSADDDVGAGARATHEALAGTGLAVDLRTLPGLGHRMPPAADLTAALRPVLAAAQVPRP